MKKKFLCLALVFLLCLAFAACGTAKNKETKETTTQTTEAAVKEKVFKTSDDKFQLTADEDWKEASDLLEIDDAALSLAKKAEGYIALISEYKYNFSNGLSGYNNLVIRHMQKNIEKDESSEPEKIKLGDYEAYKTTMTGEVEGVAQAYSIYCAEIGDNYIQLICWSKENGQKEFSREFDKIAKTLSEVKE